MVQIKRVNLIKVSENTNLHHEPDVRLVPCIFK